LLPKKAIESPLTSMLPVPIPSRSIVYLKSVIVSKGLSASLITVRHRPCSSPGAGTRGWAVGLSVAAVAGDALAVRGVAAAPGVLTGAPVGAVFVGGAIWPEQPTRPIARRSGPSRARPDRGEIRVGHVRMGSTLAPRPSVRHRTFVVSFGVVSTLSPSDYEGVLDLVVDVAANGSLDEPVSPTTLERIRALIPTADTVAYWFGPSSRHGHALTVAGDHLPWSAADDRLLERLDFSDPLLPAPDSLGRARRLSDAMAPEVYRGTEYYRRLGRTHGLEYSIAIWLRLSDGGIRGLWLDASRRDFDDRDVSVLQLIGRQLGRLLRPVRRPAVGARLPDRLLLTDRQAEILSLAAIGRSNDEIGHDLSISSNTVRTHLENVFERLEVHTRAAAVARAWELGILPRTPRRLT
jgi:DNA-binding CsgD family transcriptional regulator